MEFSFTLNTFVSTSKAIWDKAMTEFVMNQPPLFHTISFNSISLSYPFRMLNNP